MKINWIIYSANFVSESKQLAQASYFTHSWDQSFPNSQSVIRELYVFIRTNLN